MFSIEKMLLSLDGLSVGDAFGARLGEGRSTVSAAHHIDRRQLPPGPWLWTDDTHMALSIVEILAEFETIDQDALAESFAERYEEDPYRGYGGGAARILARIADGGDWRRLAPRLFDGGSYGNGGAMRAAPIGGYFAGAPGRAAKEGKRSARITHAHPEGQVGGMAVAAAAAIAAAPDHPQGAAFLAEVTQYIPESETLAGIRIASRIPAGDFDAAVKLGTGWQVSAQDTVPFCLWCAAFHLDDYEAALWQTAEGAGDRDTTCAIVGGIVALSSGKVPQAWIDQREPLPGDFAV
jgi:ADP-ribosylglycohydrolase